MGVGASHSQSNVLDLSGSKNKPLSLWPIRNANTFAQGVGGLGPLSLGDALPILWTRGLLYDFPRHAPDSESDQQDQA